VSENRVLRRIFRSKRDEVTEKRRKLHNEELHNLYSFPNIIRQIKSWRMRWMGACGMHGRGQKSVQGKRPLGRQGYRWEDGTRMDLMDTNWGGRVDSVGSG
jgi:hypothetical protein